MQGLSSASHQVAMVTMATVVLVVMLELQAMGTMPMAPMLMEFQMAIQTRLAQIAREAVCNRLPAKAQLSAACFRDLYLGHMAVTV